VAKEDRIVLDDDWYIEWLQKMIIDGNGDYHYNLPIQPIVLVNLLGKMIRMGHRIEELEENCK